MLKKAFAIGMLGCILLQTLMSGVWVLRYYVKKAEYLERCENRDKPQLQCHGKCQLKKELQKMSCCARDESSGQPEKAPAPPAKTKEQQDFSAFILPAPSIPLSFDRPAPADAPATFRYAAAAGRLWSGDVFHPPTA